MKYLPSFSGWWRAALCPASAILPRVEEIGEPAERGKAIHEYLANVGRLGKEEALALVSPEWREACEAIPIEILPYVDPDQYAHEVTFILDLRTGEAIELGRGPTARNRPAERGAWQTVGTVDLLGLTEDRAVVLDWKTGYSRAEPAHRNWQVRMGALAACRVFNKPKATVGLLYLGKDGEPPWFDCADLDEFDLAVFRHDAHALAGALFEQALREAPRTVLGAHCRYCPARVSCPAQMSLVRELAEHPAGESEDIKKAITPELVRSAYERYRVVKAALANAGAALKAYAAEYPIDLGDGLWYGEKVTQPEELDGEVAFEVISEQLGLAAARAACEMTTSKEAIKRVVRPFAKARDVTIKSLNDAALDEIRKRGGAGKATRVTIKEHHRRPGEILIPNPARLLGPGPAMDDVERYEREQEDDRTPFTRSDGEAPF